MTSESPNQSSFHRNQRSLPASSGNVIDRFLANAAAAPDRPALWIEEKILSYAQVRTGMMKIAATLQSVENAGDDGPVAFIADRSLGS